jgi:hypothetical protein
MTENQHYTGGGGWFPYPDMTDIADVPGDLRKLGERLDVVLYTAANKPWHGDLFSWVEGRVIIRVRDLPTGGYEVAENTICFLVMI